MVANIYFQLTAEFNAHGRVAVLASGQAVVYYRLALMSKDGDWIVRETDEACRRIRHVLAAHGARYRAGAPLDPRWLSGGWSSHLEFADSRDRRIRCDFFSRPPRVSRPAVESLFTRTEPESLAVVDIPALIRMKQTQRAKDYPIIGELSRLLPPDEEIELTTDPDRILVLAPSHGQDSSRDSVRAARDTSNRLAVVQAMAVEIDRLQQADRRRVEGHARVSRRYLRELGKLDRAELKLPEGHDRLCRLAATLLPQKV